ncbi:hypothetical protein P2H44_20225 [Albimonas sp. CAU 1670]|uniref:hypothetical protein n=1 Tax=Albimonas sp. CAU 1670 TaxID=3032599 RepID=UPI0023DB943B|nr:hypothetical protein [Albimonas sp. CAU 1670]MDF2234893.1 hypothetical protein [Albimonas sp. CAU 1670]
MFELLVGLFAISAISCLAALVALMKPYHPFRSRIGALQTLGLGFLCAVAAMFGAGIINDTRATFDPAQHLASARHEGADTTEAPADAPAAVLQPPAESARALRIAAEAAALAEARAEEEAAQPDAAPGAIPGALPVAAAGREPPSAEAGGLLSAIASADWDDAQDRLARLRAGGWDLAAILSQAERAARAKVRGVSASDPASARDGYLLLAALDPTDPSYAEKADSFAAAAERAAPAGDVADRLERVEDPATGEVWLEHPDRPRYVGSRSTVMLAIGPEGQARPQLRMRTVYAAREWLFVDTVQAVFAGRTESLSAGWFEREDGAATFEWRDERPDPAQLAILRALAAADDAILRFSGLQESRDVPFARADREALADMLAAWDELGGNG